MTVGSVATPANLLQEAARQAWRQSVADGRPLTPAELGDRFRRSPRWARDRITEARAASGPVPNGRPVDGPVSNGRPVDGPVSNGRPVDGPVPNGRPVDGPVPNGRVAGDRAEPAETPTAEPVPVAETIVDPVPVADVRQLVRLRWAVRAVLVFGVAASIAGNVLHAQENPISQAIAAWPPLALLLTVELISRVPVHRRGLAAARWAATATIAGIAAWVSYWHMVGVAARYGETGTSPYLLPLSVDGLVVVASVCLVELGGRIADRNRRRPPLR